MFDVSLGRFKVAGVEVLGTDILALGIAGIGYARYEVAMQQYISTLSNVTTPESAKTSNALIPGLDRAQQEMYALLICALGISLLPRLMK